MATAIMILTNEGGRERVTTIAASKEAAREVVGIAKRATGSKFVGVESMAALPLLSEAWAAIDGDWAALRCGRKVSKSEPKTAENKGV